MVVMWKVTSVWCVAEDRWWKENDKKPKIGEYLMRKLITGFWDPKWLEVGCPGDRGQKRSLEVCKGGYRAQNGTNNWNLGSGVAR